MVGMRLQILRVQFFRLYCVRCVTYSKQNQVGSSHLCGYSSGPPSLPYCIDITLPILRAALIIKRVIGIVTLKNLGFAHKAS